MDIYLYNSNEHAYSNCSKARAGLKVFQNDASILTYTYNVEVYERMSS